MRRISIHHRGWQVLALLALVSALTCPTAFPQNRNAGEVRGTVLDASGAAVPGVDITITETQTGIVTRVTTGGSGVYAVPSLSPGTYAISFAREGFKKYVRDGIVLRVESITVNATLEVGAATEAVTVTGEVPLLQTESSDRKTILAGTDVRELPSVGRSWYDMTVLLPGTNPGTGLKKGQSAGGETVGLNGTGSYQMNWLVDGGTATYLRSQNVGPSIPLEAIAEVNMATNNFGAEYGNGLAVFSVITKSGTNQFHGSLFEYVQNNAFQARNFFSPSVATYRWNQYGGTIGGPVRRDKMFFFFSYQRNPSSTPTGGYYTEPTASMREGDFSAAGLRTVYDPATLTYENGKAVRSPFPGNKIPSNRFDAVAAKIQGYIPATNLPGDRGGLIRNLYWVDSKTANTVQYNAKVDYNVSSSNRITGSLMLAPQASFTPHPDCPLDCMNEKMSWPSAQLTDVWTIAPTLVNEARVSLLRFGGTWSAPNQGQGYPGKIGMQNLQADQFPTINMSGSVNAGVGGGYHAALGYTTFTYSDTLTWIKGRHIIKAGGEANRWRQNLGWPDQDPGRFDFYGNATLNPVNGAGGEGYADFLLGQYSYWSVSSNPITGGRSWNLQTFVADDFKMRPNLTLNLGLRVVTQAGWSEVLDRVTSFDPTIVNPATSTAGGLWWAGLNGRRALQDTVPAFLSPRVGFAWTPAPAWSIRGGYGIYPMMWGGDGYSNGQGNGWAIQGSRSMTDNMTPVGVLSNGGPAPRFPTEHPDPLMLNNQNIFWNLQDTPMSYVEQYSLVVQRQLQSSWFLEGSYVGNRSVHLNFTRDINQVPAQLLGPGNAQSRRPYPQYRNITAALYDGMSKYHAFQMTLRKRFSSGFSMATNYTFSKGMDSGSSSGWGGAVVGVDNYQSAYDWRANWGPFQADLRHTVNGSFVYELPLGKNRAFVNRGGILNAAIGGWQVSGIFQAHSGLPFTPVMGTTNLSGALSGSWRPNRLGDGQIDDPTIAKWFDFGAFKQPEQYTFGSSGRNILRGPGFGNLNLSLAKSFHIQPLGEQAALQIRADSTNVLNHANMGLPNAQIGTVAVGTIYSAAAARNFQLGARLSF